MPNPFDYAKSFDNRVYIEDDSGYNSIIINKKLSLLVDTIMYANEMNINHGLDNKLQYDYLYYSIRPNKRRPFIKWPKDNSDETLGLIQEYFGFNRQKARQALNILSKDQLEQIKTLLIRDEK